MAAPITLGLGACEFPTELPEWNTTWVVPVESTTIGVRNLLPDLITPAGDAFVVGLQESFSRRLGQMCGALCTPFNGRTVPKPGFTARFGSTFNIPGDIMSARLAGGQVQFRVSHNFGFDPIRPSATSRGYILLTVSSGGVQIARDSIAGEDDAFPSGTTLTRTLTVSPPTISGPITLDVTVNSPMGDPARVDTNSRITFTPVVRVSEAQVRLGNQSIAGEQVELNLDVDEGLADRTRGGALLLDIENPFAVTGNLTLTISAPNTTIEKQVQLRQGANATRIEFNEREIQSILKDRPVRLSVRGTVTGSPTVRPSQVVTIRSRLELTLGPNGED